MLTVAKRLAEAGLALPDAPAPAGLYVPAVRTGDLVFTAGQLPMRSGVLLTTGTVGDEVSPAMARECAAQCCLNALAAASTVCDIERVRCVVKLVGYVASSGRFVSQPGVIDGASEVLATAFAELGVHAREAVGVAQLPLGAPVEVSLILEVSS